MKFSFAPAIPVMAMVLSASATPVEIETRFAAGITYVGPVTPGGENVTLFGSAKEIYEQIIQLNPSFNPDEFETIRIAKAKHARYLEARGEMGPVCHVTTQPYTGNADAFYIQAGIDYLHGLPGDCNLGPHLSSRISCSYNSAIFWVNNNNWEAWSTCYYLGDMAQNILDNCAWFDYSIHHTNGQEADTANFVVLVCSSNC